MRYIIIANSVGVLFVTNYFLLQFNKWFSNVEQDVEAEKDSQLLAYMESLEESRRRISDLLDSVGSGLEELQSLETNYHFVSNKTNSLHTSCRQLIEEQVRLLFKLNIKQLFYISYNFS